MDERKNKYRDPWDNEIYGTGSTQPRKSHGGKISALLMIGIFFCGMVSTLGLMKIRLFTLNIGAEDPTISIAFHGTEGAGDASVSATTPSQQDPVKAGSVALGISGESISRFHQKFYRWPAGFYITSVEDGSDAAKHSIVPGDILVSVENISAADISAVQKLLQSSKPGDTLTLTVYRNSRLFSVELTLSHPKN